MSGELAMLGVLAIAVGLFVAGIAGIAILLNFCIATWGIQVGVGMFGLFLAAIGGAMFVLGIWRD